MREKKEKKIKPVVGFNETDAKDGFGNMGKVNLGNDTIIEQIEGTSIGSKPYISGKRSIEDNGKATHDLDTKRAEKRFDDTKLSQLDYNAKGQPIHRSTMDNPNLNKETTAEPAHYNEEVGIVIGYENPLDRLNAIIERGLIDNTENLFMKALETMRAKNADYSGDNKSMRNFEISAEVSHIPMSKGILNRLMDKITRIGNLLNKDQAAVKDESIFDTIQDAINYSAILYFGILMEQRDRLVKQNEALAAYEEERNG